jgi:hypothetical protein
MYSHDSMTAKGDIVFREAMFPTDGPATKERLTCNLGKCAFARPAPGDLQLDPSDYSPEISSAGNTPKPPVLSYHSRQYGSLRIRNALRSAEITLLMRMASSRPSNSL